MNASTSNVESVAVLALTNLTLAANLTTVTFPNGTTLSGTLTRVDNGVGIPGKQVILEHKPAGASGFTKVDDPAVVNPVTTGADGSFSLVGVQPTKNTEYRVKFAEDHASRLNASISDSETVEVKVGLTLKVSRATVTLGKKVTISGAVSPAHTGSVQLTIKRGKTVVVNFNQKSVPLNNSSLYKTTFKPTRTDSYTVIVSFAGDDDDLGNTATKKFKVTG